MKVLFVALIFLVQFNAVARVDHFQNNAFLEKQTSQVLSFIPGSIEDMRQPIINDLISSDMPALDSPPNPRIWTERTKSDIIVSNTKLGAKVPIVDIGSKLSIEFKYGLKTSFVIVSSKRKDDKSHAQKKSMRPFKISSTSEDVLNFDESTFQTYPNVRPGYPMVGFCVFEASLAIDKNIEGGFDFIVGETGKKGTLETMSNAIFSNFFQLSSEIPVNTYLEKVCDGIFKKEVEPMVVNDFSKMVMEKIVSQNPKSDCTPNRSADEADSGDASCLEWHSSFAEPIRNLTVPRCILQVNGAHRCRLKARQGTACPMYIDPHTQTYSPNFKSFDGTILATDSHYSYSCDKKAGLSCVMEKEPTLLRGIPLVTGKARCQSDKQN
ncbi:MAG: hypothetical protein ACXVCY_15695 [Pseudobdellovibrionaceae bacterium]